MDAFYYYPWLFPFFATLFGLIIGSFLNVVIYRLPKMMDLAWRQEFAEAYPEYGIKIPDTDLTLSLPHSFCPQCHHPIKIYHNIPVLSWLGLHGRCAYCKKKISIRYPLVELLSALCSCLIAIHFGMVWFTCALLIFTYMIITAAFIDFDTMLLPDAITLPLMWFGIVLSVLHITPVTLYDSIVGAIVGYLSLWTLYWAFKLLTGKDGMGYGDFKLLAALGAWLGWNALPMVILMSSLIGVIFGMIQLTMQKKGMDRSFPFGPYLAIAGWCYLMYGNHIMNWIYSSMLGN